MTLGALAPPRVYEVHRYSQCLSKSTGTFPHGAKPWRRCFPRFPSSVPFVRSFAAKLRVLFHSTRALSVLGEMQENVRTETVLRITITYSSPPRQNNAPPRHDAKPQQGLLPSRFRDTEQFNSTQVIYPAWSLPPSGCTWGAKAAPSNPDCRFQIGIVTKIPRPASPLPGEELEEPDPFFG